MRVVVEVGAPGAVVEQPRRTLPGLRLGHPADELLGVSGPLLVEQREDGEGDLLDVLGLTAPGGVDEALVEGQVLHPLGALLAVDDLGEEVRVAPFGVHVRDGQEAVEVVEADVLRLRLDVLADVPLPDGLGDIASVGEQLGQGDLAVEPARLPVHRRPEEAVPHRQAAGHQ